MNDICPLSFVFVFFSVFLFFFKFTYLIRTKEGHTEALIAGAKL